MQRRRVLEGLVLVAGHDDRDEHGVPVLGDQRRVLGLVVGGEDALDDLGAEPGDLGGEAVDVGLVGRVVDGERRRPDDDEVGHLLRAGEAVLDEALPGDAGRLAGAELGLRGDAAAHQGRRAEHGGGDQQHEHGDGPERMRRGGAGEALRDARALGGSWSVVCSLRFMVTPQVGDSLY